MIHVAAVEQDHRRRAGRNEITRDREDKVAAIHVFAKTRQCLVIQLGALRPQFFSPTVEHFAERVPIVLESDRILEHRGAHPLGRCFDHAETVGAANTPAHDMAAPNPKMIEQREMIRGISMPPVGRANRSTRTARIPLIYRDYAEVLGQLDSRIKRTAMPELDTRAHPARREQQQRMTGTIFLVVQRYASTFE